MKLLVLGATGGIGVEIVRQAVERGHSVTALVRNADALRSFTDRISIRAGNLLDVSALASSIAGHDAVLSAFGPRQPMAKTDAHLLRDFGSALVAAATQAKVPRVLIVSTAFLFRDAVFPPAHLVGRLFFPGVVADATDMEEIVSRSGLDWTLVRPPQLNDKPRTGRYRVREGHLPAFGFSIGRADVADFMLDTAERRRFARAVVGVAA
jgi:putative NADH-flavin reductase